RSCLFNLEASPQSRQNAIYFAHSSCPESPFRILLCAMSKSPEFSSSEHKQLLAGLNIFNTASLTSEEDIAVAVAVLEDTLDERSTGPIIHCSLQPEHPYAFEFVISFVNGVTSTYISDFVLNKFPLKISAFHSSLGYEIVSRLSRSLLQLPYPPNARPEGLDDHCHRTQMAPSILEDLCMLLQPNFFEEADSSNRKIRTTQQSKTLRRKAPTGAHTEINDRLFRALGPQVPRTRESAEDMIKSIVDSQKDTLKSATNLSLRPASSFFALLRLPEVKTLVRNAYFRGNTSQGEQVDAAMPPAKGANHSSSITGGDPIQADLHFQSAAGYGQWRILCSRAFLSDMTRDNALSNEVLRRLRELSSGCFDETNQKRLTRDSPIDIFRARLSGSKRLVYLIDVVPEFGSDLEFLLRTRGSLRILGIYSLDKLNRNHWEKVGRYRAEKGREYIEKGTPRWVYYPMSFGAAATQVATTSTESSLQDQEMEEVDEIHRLFDLEQYSILSQNVIRDILEGREYPRVFQVSLAEKKVIEFTKSSFVLGRSGTGKTTVIVFKIFGIERAWQNRGSVGPRPRQLFITKSQLLANKVEQDYVNLLYSLSAGPNMPQYVRERLQHWNSCRRNNVLDPDDSEGTRDDLPEKFSELQDSHFPLFITVDTLWSLLEADMRPPPSRGRHSRSQQSNNKWLRRTDLVTFDVFKRMYWRHLPQTLTKGIVPSVAFGDIIGTIKGSEKSLDFLNRALDRGTYESLTNRNYTLFEAYQKLKRERGERDLADRTHDLLDKIKEKGLKGELVDFVYVDEVQDLLLIDARLIVSLCRNPDGFLWAGDTAQTISIGSTFSFKQLGSFVYRYQKSIRAVRGIPSHPKGFQLLVNYRSHGGIVKCANAIIQLLQRFPGAIDVLQPEAERDFFLLSTGRTCMLGSKQCIIVRDEAARQKLRTDIGPVGIILTLFNSKGLEYDDVILYDFFGESANANLWRHLTDAQPHPLEDLKHAPLIYELKSLGVVRGRQATTESRRIEEAAMAFENAGDVYTQAVAVAFHLREVARDTPESAIKRRREAFVAAADAFEHCAAMADNDEEEHSRYVAARALLCRNQVPPRAPQRGAELFDDEEEQMEFVVEHEFGVARAVILGKQRKYGEAVRQYLDEGQELEALELALDHIDDITQDLDAFNAIITKVLWRYLSFGRRGWSENMRIPASKISKLLKTIPLQGLRIREQQMRDVNNIRKTLAGHILRCDPLDRASKLLALDLYFDDMSSALDVSSQSGIVSSLHLFHEYSLLMRDGALDRAPWDSPWLCTLFQIETDGEDVRTKPGTFFTRTSRERRLDLKNKAANFSRDIQQDTYRIYVSPAYSDVSSAFVGEHFSTLRNNVVQMAVSLRRLPSPESIAFHWRYVNSRQWADLAEALYQSTTSPFDRLVRLRLESSLISGPQIPGVDLVTFRDKNSIPINTEGSYAAISGQVTATDGIDGTGDQHIEGAAEYSADDAVDIDDGEGPDRSREAIIIQKAVRRYLLKRTEGSSDDKFEDRTGPSFQSLQGICKRSSRQASKGTIKARRAEATLQELSDLTLQQEEMNDILKKARELHRRLEPGSRLHPRADIRSGWDAGCDLIPLRSALMKARDLFEPWFERLSDPRFPAVFSEFEFAWNAIMPSKLRR
ncbi:hypothetical protein BJY52DRAFT_1396510, partial [Lactarius psammicola]